MLKRVVDPHWEVKAPKMLNSLFTGLEKVGIIFFAPIPDYTVSSHITDISAGSQGRRRKFCHLKSSALLAFSVGARIPERYVRPASEEPYPTVE